MRESLCLDLALSRSFLSLPSPFSVFTPTKLSPSFHCVIIISILTSSLRFYARDRLLLDRSVVPILGDDAGSKNTTRHPTPETRHPTLTVGFVAGGRSGQRANGEKSSRSGRISQYTLERTGSEFRGTSPLNSKFDGNSSPMEIASIRGPQRALESLMYLQKCFRRAQKASEGLRRSQRALEGLTKTLTASRSLWRLPQKGGSRRLEKVMKFG